MGCPKIPIRQFFLTLSKEPLIPPPPLSFEHLVETSCQFYAITIGLQEFSIAWFDPRPLFEKCQKLQCWYIWASLKICFPKSVVRFLIFKEQLLIFLYFHCQNCSVTLQPQLINCNYLTTPMTACLYWTYEGARPLICTYRGYQRQFFVQVFMKCQDFPGKTFRI